MFDSYSEDDLSSDDRSTLDSDYKPSSSDLESTMSGKSFKQELRFFWTNINILEANFDLSFDDVDTFIVNNRDPFNDTDSIFANMRFSGISDGRDRDAGAEEQGGMSGEAHSQGGQLRGEDAEAEVQGEMAGEAPTGSPRQGGQLMGGEPVAVGGRAELAVAGDLISRPAEGSTR